MGKDIFGYKRNSNPEGTVSSTTSVITFGGGGGTGKIGNLIQSWNVSYQRNIQEIYELGSEAIYWSKGRPVGSGQIGRIVGVSQKSDALFFPEDAWTGCNGGVTMSVANSSKDCENKAGGKVKFKTIGTVITSFGMSAQVGNTSFGENFAFKFAKLEIN